jgi:hypothetical protein
MEVPTPRQTSKQNDIAVVASPDHPIPPNISEITNEQREMFAKSVDAEILEFVLEINYVYGLETDTSCAGHLWLGGPNLGIMVPAQDTPAFYSTAYEICGPAYQTMKQFKAHGRTVELDDFCCGHFQIHNIRNLYSYMNWKDAPAAPILFVWDEKAEHEADLERQRDQFFGSVRTFVAKFLEYRRHRKLPPILYRMMIEGTPTRKL